MALPPVTAVANGEEPAQDDGGPDDEPGQKDLNTLAIDGTLLVTEGVYKVDWTHDIIETSGNNTGDSCAVFDSNGDGNANYMLCVSWQNNKNDALPHQVGESPLLYECEDKHPQKCSGNASGVVPDEDLAYCSLSIVDDAFGTRGKSQGSDEFDLQISCSITRALLLGDSAVLTNVCSYPSKEPTSDPSDCIFEDATVFLEINKTCEGGFDNDAAFAFTLAPAGTLVNDPAAMFTLDCADNQSIGPIRIRDDVSYTITEEVDGSFLVDANCSITADDTTMPLEDVFDGINTVTLPAFTANAGQTISCTFNNSAGDEPGDTGAIVITKTGETPGSCVAAWFFSSLGKFDLCVAENLFGVPPEFQTRKEGVIEFTGLDPEAPPLSDLYFPYKLVDLSDDTVIAEANFNVINDARIAGKYVFWEKSPIVVVNARYSDFFQLSCAVTADDNGIQESLIDTVDYASIKIGSKPAYLGHLAIIDLAPGETVNCTFVNVKRGRITVIDDGVAADLDLLAEVNGTYTKVAVVTTGDGVDDRVSCLLGVEQFCYFLRPSSTLALLRPSVNDIDGFDGSYALCPADQTPDTATCEEIDVAPNADIDISAP